MTEWNYSAGSGIWELELDGTLFKLKPTRGDKRKFIDYIKNRKKTKSDEGEALAKFEEYAYKIITRDYPANTNEEEETLKSWIELHSNELMDEFMLFFRLTTKERLKKMVEKVEDKVDQKIDAKLEEEMKDDKEEETRTDKA